MKEVIDEFLTDNCPHLAASISYYLLFSLFPLTLGIIVLVGFFTTSAETEADVVKAICDFLPLQEGDVQSSIEGVANSRPAIGAIATIGLLWSGSAVFNAIRKALNTAWGIKKPRPFFVERAMELGMMFGAGVLLFISIGVTSIVHFDNSADISIGGVSFFNGTLMKESLLSLITIVLAFFTFLFLYKVIPNTRVRWSDVWGGALLAAVGFEVVKRIFIWYAGNYAHYTVIYGAVGTIIALLIWTYISALILLFCAKLTAVYSRHRISFFGEATWQGKRRIRKRFQTFSPLARSTTLNGHRSGFTPRAHPHNASETPDSLQEGNHVDSMRP